MMRLEDQIREYVENQVARAATITRYRQPLVGYVSAGDSRFRELRHLVSPNHRHPRDLLPSARSVVSFFVPVDTAIVRANRRGGDQVASEWPLAYVETNDLIDSIAKGLIADLAAVGIAAAAEPATHNWDPVAMVSWWSHKSVAVIAGLGSFGLHHMVITDSGCAGRFGSIVLGADLEPAYERAGVSPARCRYLLDGGCRACVARCPVGALTEDGLDKRRCYERCLEVAEQHQGLGLVEVCGKCATGPCALRSGVT
jgi:epoxyqueuosine reductase